MRREAKGREFAKELWTWFGTHKRTLPWRDLKIKDDTQRAYMVIVSEVMLQQTQVPRVIVIFKRFLEQFPTIGDLAKASNKEVIIAWRGMGYNSRALRLRDAAKSVVTEHKGKFPKEYDELIAIKGIGPYTAAAIRNFAFGIPTPCVDTNIRRILHRVFIKPENPDGTWEKSEKQIVGLSGDVLQIALDTTPKKKTAAQDWHATLMDFGSAVCKKSVPMCDSCPMNDFCNSAFKVKRTKSKQSTEPGRVVAGKHIPNRIFRGRVVDALRDAHHGLVLSDIGARISVDWNPKEHREWLQSLLMKLEKDGMIRKRGLKYVLYE